MNDRERLALELEEQANFCAWRCQYHTCGATCVKYSYAQAAADGETKGAEEESRFVSIQDASKMRAHRDHGAWSCAHQAVPFTD